MPLTNRSLPRHNSFNDKEKRERTKMNSFKFDGTTTSGNGLQSKLQSSNSRNLFFCFLAGFLTAVVLVQFQALSFPPSLSSILKYLKVSSTTEGNDCQISFGDYKGPIYSTEAGGTVGQPKCLVESKFMKLQLHHVRMPAGSNNIIPDWLWIDYHERINVLVQAPPTGDDKRREDKEPHFLVFEQTKYALEGRMSLAVVGGIIEPGEQPEHAAGREVEEEMHVKCENYHFLGRFRTDVNRGAGWTNSFLAMQCSPAAAAVTEKAPDNKGHSAADNTEEVGVADTERQNIKIISLEELRQAAQDGKFLEIQWSATVALSLLHPELTKYL